MSVASLPLNRCCAVCEEELSRSNCFKLSWPPFLLLKNRRHCPHHVLFSPSVSLTVLAQSMLPLRDLQHDSKHEELQRLQQATLLQCVSRPLALVACHQTCSHLCVAQNEMCACLCWSQAEAPHSLPPLLFIRVTISAAPSEKSPVCCGKSAPPPPFLLSRVGVGVGGVNKGNS